MATPTPTSPERIVRFTVDMPESLHQRLTQAAARVKCKKAVVVRVSARKMGL